MAVARAVRIKRATVRRLRDGGACVLRRAERSEAGGGLCRRSQGREVPGGRDLPALRADARWRANNDLGDAQRMRGAQRRREVVRFGPKFDVGEIRQQPEVFFAPYIRDSVIH